MMWLLTANTKSLQGIKKFKNNLNWSGSMNFIVIEISLELGVLIYRLKGGNTQQKIYSRPSHFQDVTAHVTNLKHSTAISYSNKLCARQQSV